MSRLIIASRTITATIYLSVALVGSASELVKARDGSGNFGYKDTPKLPWCEWLVHDPDRPAPKRVNPGQTGLPATAPSDAIVLFDGRGTNRWDMADWKVEEGCLVSGDKVLATKQTFGSAQIHVEWMVPQDFEGPWYNRGNNGVLLMGLYEVQIIDSYSQKLYPDGYAGAIYGQTPPLVNATRPPGEWQTYDIFFSAPVFESGKLISPARVTVIHNGVLIQLNTEIHGETVHRELPAYKSQKSQGPLCFSGHGCPVRFRNIWFRPL